MAIKRERVDSTCLRSMGYDKETKTASLEFRKSGAVYEYDGPSARAFNRVKDADSIGGEFNRSFRNVYPYRRVRRGTPRRGAKKHR